MEDLVFTEKDGGYESSLVSQGNPIVVHLVREKNSAVSVTAALGDLPEVAIGAIDNPYSTDEIFSVDVPQGVKITVRSLTEVAQAKVLM